MSLSQRVALLERNNRLMRIAFVSCLLIFGCAAMMGAVDKRTVEVETIRAQRFELIDDKGNLAGYFGKYPGKERYELVISRGDQIAHLFVEGKLAKLALLSEESSVIHAALRSSGISAWTDEKGKDRIMILGDRDDPRLAVLGRDGERKCSVVGAFSSDKEGKGYDVGHIETRGLNGHVWMSPQFGDGKELPPR